MIAVCPVFRKKEHKTGKRYLSTRQARRLILALKPFVFPGFVSLSAELEKVPITIIRDTGAYHSFIMANVFPLSDKTSCFSDLLVWGIKMSEINALFHMVHLFSPLVSGHVKVAVLPRFPISCVTFVLGNDLAGGNVFPLPEVVNDPISLAPACCPISVSSELSVPNVFFQTLDVNIRRECILNFLIYLGEPVEPLIEECQVRTPFSLLTP